MTPPETVPDRQQLVEEAILDILAEFGATDITITTIVDPLNPLRIDDYFNGADL